MRRGRGDSILPGFIDLQVNGGWGIDVMSATAEDLVKLARRLAGEGVTGWLPTVITAPLEKIESCDTRIAAAMKAQRELRRARRPGEAGAEILGMHLEGPFISAQRRGAHPPMTMAAQGEAVERVLRLKTLRLITLAPEVPGAVATIRRLRARGIAVSLGHSDASYNEALAGVKAGARMFTHTFNAMRPLHHRDPGIAGAALGPAAARAAFIPDGVHLHPSVYGFLYRARGPRGLVVTTDRIALSGANATAMLFGQPADGVTARDGAARLADGTLAGSTINMLDGLHFLSKVIGGAGFDQFAYATMAAASPAWVLGRKERGRIAPGARADLILLGRRLELKAVFIGGCEVD